MLGNDRMETESSEGTSIQRRNDGEISTKRTHRYFVDFESRIHVEISKTVAGQYPAVFLINDSLQMYFSRI